MNTKTKHVPTTPALSKVEPVIEARQVVHAFGGRRVLNGVSFRVDRGETLVVIGSSGCGKSTLLRILTGSVKPTSGQVRVLGEDVCCLSTLGLTELRRRIGVLLQSGALLQSLTVSENVALPIEEHTRLDPAIIDLMVKMKLALVGLGGSEHLKPAELSGGMRKRAGLARALALDPELLFSDEPTSGLDPVMTAGIDQLTQRLTQALGLTALVVTHDMKSAFRIGTRILMLGTGSRQGTIIAEGTAEAILESQDPMVRQFIEGQTDGPMGLRMSSKDYLNELMKNHVPLQCP